MVNKVSTWKQKLLDLGKRNRLLNFKETKRGTFKIITPEISELYDIITNGKTLEFPVYDEKTLTLIITEKSIIGDKIGIEYDKTLYNIQQKAKTAIEEQGVNVLYLAFGFVSWVDKIAGNEELISPLVLVPVQITRGSIVDKYKLKMYDDEIILNPTLMFKFENDYNIKLDKDALDMDEFNIMDYLIQINDKVAELNWSVLPDVQLGLFSFAKMNMYQDLKVNEEKVLANPLIKALCGEATALDKVPDYLVNSDDMDKIVMPMDTFNVVDADSSQQQAILAAENGVSFVLQGPPGTGKSQTITNIIAENLANGKKILFVAEKMAALEVVYRNLKRVGLDDFCLQLHSHKANKLEVVKELADTLQKPKTMAKDSAIEDLKELSELIIELNEHAQALHKLREPLNTTVFKMYGMIEQLKNYEDVTYKPMDVNVFTGRDLAVLCDIIEKYILQLGKIKDDIENNAWYGFNMKTLTFEAQKDIEINLKELIESLNKYIDIIESIKDNYFITEMDCPIESINKIEGLMTLLTEKHNLPYTWLLSDSIQSILNTTVNVATQYSNLTALENQILPTYEAGIFTINAAEMLRKFKGEYSGFFRFFKSAYRRDIRLLKGFANNAKYKPKYIEAVAQLELIKQIQEIGLAINADEKPLIEWYGQYYSGRNSNFNELNLALSWILNIRNNITNINEQIAQALLDTTKADVPTNILKKLGEVKGQLNAQLQYFIPLFNAEEFSVADVSARKLYQKANNCLTNMQYIYDWVDFYNQRMTLREAKLEPFVNEVKEMGIPKSDWVNTLRKRFALLWLDNIYQNEPALASFRRDKFEGDIEKYRLLDKAQFKIAQARIRQKLSAERPDSTSFTSRGTEIHTLLREAEKKRKLLPVRKLFEKIPNLLLKIKPCLLMSPLSVSLFLNPDLYQFDIVIFDEASQVCTENAVGAIYRGKQLIVVGDREQLPPTNFFSNSASDNDFASENEEEDEEDSYESILDECNSVLNKLPLKWHYRSRHEHLIAYSNAKIYKNLVTFPTPVGRIPDFGVEFIYVPEGVYDRRVTRSNKVEAQKIAELVFKHFENNPERSLGVVTFSEAQQTEVDNAINEFRKQRPEFEKFFFDELDEPFFIKNLENVQGDERDTIIFSVGYGKDHEGKMSLNFGPLNKEGGYRRLNVAITRAKYNVKLVSSILPSDINISKTEAKGVIMLRGYMEFAQKGMVSIENTETLEAENEDKVFEKEIQQFLKDNGYDAELSLGCSEYKLDIVVKHPEKEGIYVIAIECDGNVYNSAKTARDRDRLREDVLALRKWTHYRIWSTDWLRHRATEEQNLLKAVQNSIDNYDKEIEEIEVIVPENKEKTVETVIKSEKPKALEFTKYIKANPADVVVKEGTEPLQHAVAIINHIVKVESPIHKELVYRHMAPLYGREKVTVVITREIDAMIDQMCKDTIEVDGDICWTKGRPTPIFRVPQDSENKREIKQITIEELTEGMKIIIDYYVGIEKNMLFLEVAKALGFNRVGDNITSALNEAFIILMQRGEIEVTGETIGLKK